MGPLPDLGPAPDTGLEPGPDSGFPTDPDTGATDTGAADTGAADTGRDAGVRPDAPPPFDGGFRDASAGMDATPADVTFPDAGTSNTSAQIAAVRALVDGPVNNLPIDDAMVTYVRANPAGADRAGFYVQGERAGPAIFVAVSPSTLSPPPRPGDIVRFLVTNRATDMPGGLRYVGAVTQYARTGMGNVATILQEGDVLADLTTALDAYESELLHLSGTVAGSFSYGGIGHLVARIETPAITGDMNLELRVPITLQQQLGLGTGCAFELRGTPMWRYMQKAQPSANELADIAVPSCPAPRLIGAQARSPTLVILSFDRALNPNTVSASGSDFAIGAGVTPISATVNGAEVRLTTTSQAPGTSYTVTVTGGVRDVRGSAVDASFRTAAFTGGFLSAVVRINELNANLASGCDLIELRAVTGGSLDGWTLRYRLDTLVVFQGLTVRPNDYIVVHLNGASPNCNPGSPQSANETSSPSQAPRSVWARNFDTAYDWYAPQVGLVNTDLVLMLYDVQGNIVDAVLASDDPTGTAAAASEQAAEAVAHEGAWTAPNGSVPVNGFVDDDFSANAVLDLNASDTMVPGRSIQRTNNADTNTSSDWTDTNPSTWGANNLGQTNF